MIVKGRCRGNGAQLAAYLLDTRANDRAEFLTMHGTVRDDPRQALIEMSLSSQIYGRTSEGLYHCQLSPRAAEAEAMTWEQKRQSVEIMAEQLGMSGHKWALFEHEKDGRTHLHLVFERYNHDTRRTWSDHQNFDKHLKAARAIEKEFGWQLTHERKQHLDRDIKHRITDLYCESRDARHFVELMAKDGFEVTQGIDRRPYQLVDQYGAVHDLARQVQGFKQGQISEYLNEIRPELRPTAEASQDRRQAFAQGRDWEPLRDPLAKSENSRELSESTTLAAQMIVQYKQQVSEKEQADSQTPPTYSYSFKLSQSLAPLPLAVEVSPPLPQVAPPQEQSDKLPQKSEPAATPPGALERARQRQQRMEAMQRQAEEQTHPAKESDSLTDNAESMLARYKRRQQERGWDRGHEYEP